MKHSLVNFGLVADTEPSFGRNSKPIEVPVAKVRLEVSVESRVVEARRRDRRITEADDVRLVVAAERGRLGSLEVARQRNVVEVFVNGPEGATRTRVNSEVRLLTVNKAMSFIPSS